MSRSAEPPSPQEVQRKLSIHSKPKVMELSLQISFFLKKINVISKSHASGTESDSEIQLDISPPLSSFQPATSAPPLSSIAERHGSGDESEEEEDDGEGGWRSADVRGKPRDETVLKAGYLWKKGERRKVRFFFSNPHGDRIPDLNLSDVEKEMVRSAACASGVLQNISGVSTAQNTGSWRSAFVYCSLVEKTRQYFWSCVTR